VLVAVLALRLPEPPPAPTTRDVPVAPPPASAPLDPAAALHELWERIDAARARGVICGGRVAPAPGLHGSAPLDQAAAALAAAPDEDGRTQVKEAKFRGKLLRKVVARGATPELVARAWLDAPADCEALMDPLASHGGAAMLPAGDGYVWIVLLGRKR
jgi:hypothetical protein